MAAAGVAGLAVPVVRESADTIRVGKLLGEGSFGKVYKGEFRPDSSKPWMTAVAFKVFSGRIDAAQRAAAIVELQALARIAHEGAVRLLGVVEMNNGGLAAVLEFCPGGDVAGRISSSALPLPWSERLAIATQTAAALTHLHSVGMVHGDIKPLNVLLDGAGKAKLADFGLAVWKDGAAPAGGAGGGFTGGGTLGLTYGAYGTLNYMAPELIPASADAKVARRSPASDVYAFGILLWQLMTRREPYTDAGALRVLSMGGSAGGTAAVCSSLRAFLDKGHRPCFDADVVDASTPDFFRRIVQACWATDPAKRPSTAAVLAGLRSGRWDADIPAPGPGVPIPSSSGGAGSAAPVSPPKPAATIAIPARPRSPSPERLGYVPGLGLVRIGGSGGGGGGGMLVGGGGLGGGTLVMTPAGPMMLGGGGPMVLGGGGMGGGRLVMGPGGPMIMGHPGMMMGGYGVMPGGFMVMRR